MTQLIIPICRDPVAPHSKWKVGMSPAWFRDAPEMGVSRVIGVPHMNVCISMLLKKWKPTIRKSFSKGKHGRNNRDGWFGWYGGPSIYGHPQYNIHIYICVCVEISTYFQNTFTLKELFALTCCRSMVGPQTWMLPPGVNWHRSG